MGRPSLYTPELADAICERLAVGESLKSICADPAMPGYSTARRWEEENDAFRALSARAKDWGNDYMAEDCVHIADDPELKPDDKRIRVDTRLRLLGMWNKRYNTKIDLNHGGQKNNPVSFLIAEVSGTAFLPQDSETGDDDRS